MMEHELCEDCQSAYNELIEALLECTILRLTLRYKNDRKTRFRPNLCRCLYRRCRSLAC